MLGLRGQLTSYVNQRQTSTQLDLGLLETSGLIGSISTFLLTYHMHYPLFILSKGIIFSVGFCIHVHHRPLT
jgi:hypothetical protein